MHGLWARVPAVRTSGCRREHFSRLRAAKAPGPGRTRAAWLDRGEDKAYQNKSCAPVAQLDRALASGAKGRAFESRRARQRNQPLAVIPQGVFQYMPLPRSCRFFHKGRGRDFPCPVFTSSRGALRKTPFCITMNGTGSRVAPYGKSISKLKCLKCNDEMVSCKGF